MKTILLLGASVDQLYAIKTAKSMGLFVIVIDANPNSPGFDLADKYEVISTKDVKGIKKFIDRYQKDGKKINGVLVMGSDIPQIVAQIAKHLGTTGPSLNSALLATNKLKMKKQFKSKGIPVPWFSKVSSVRELRRIVRQRGYPLIIKPVDRSGSRGVFLLQDDSNLTKLFKKSLSFSFSKIVMIEQKLSGLQISTETLMYQGKGFTPGFADRNYEYLDRFFPKIIENGGTVPSIVSKDDKKIIEKIVEKAALALGLTDGIVKGDIVLTEKGPFVIEIAARLSGGDFSESLIPLGSGVNIVKEAIRLALNDKPKIENLKPKWNRAVANRYFFPDPGLIEEIKGEKKVRKKSWVKKLEFWYKVVDKVPQLHSHADRAGVFVVEAKTRKELEKRIKWVYKNIKIQTIPEK